MLDRVPILGQQQQQIPIAASVLLRQQPGLPPELVDATTLVAMIATAVRTELERILAPDSPPPPVSRRGYTEHGVFVDDPVTRG